MRSFTFCSTRGGPKCLKYQNFPKLWSFWLIGKPQERFQSWVIKVNFISVQQHYAFLKNLKRVVLEIDCVCTAAGIGCCPLMQPAYSSTLAPSFNKFAKLRRHARWINILGINILWENTLSEKKRWENALLEKTLGKYTLRKYTLGKYILGYFVFGKVTL